MNESAIKGAPAPDGGLLATVDRHYARLENFMAFIAAIFIFFLMIIGTTEVLTRRFFNYPLPGHIDFVELSMATMAFLSAAYCQRLGGHIRMDLAVDALKGRYRWLSETLACLVALFVVGVLLPGTWDHFVRAYELGDTTMDAQFAVWPSKLLVPIGLAVLFVRLLINLAGYMRLFGNPDLEQVAIPQQASIEDLAADEIHDAFDGAPPPSTDTTR